MNFVAIDFETANFSPESACSIGLARCESGMVTQTYQSFIRPPRLYFAQRCVEVHGIEAKDVRGCPTFRDLWEDIRSFIGQSILVAHNAPFDRRVLSSCLEWYALPQISNPWECSLQSARRNLSLPNYQLHTVAAHFGIQFHHHDALEDAVAAAQIMIEINKIKPPGCH
ncbi:MAG: 3'-5' exonuclease [Planctomycetia bacterium]|nr:3'-5' exonuclease [Planctomycetia bacterium]